MADLRRDRGRAQGKASTARGPRGRQGEGWAGGKGRAAGGQGQARAVEHVLPQHDVAGVAGDVVPVGVEAEVGAHVPEHVVQDAAPHGADGVHGGLVGRVVEVAERSGVDVHVVAVGVDADAALAHVVPHAARVTPRTLESLNFGYREIP